MSDLIRIGRKEANTAKFCLARHLDSYLFRLTFEDMGTIAVSSYRLEKVGVDRILPLFGIDKIQ